MDRFFRIPFREFSEASQPIAKLMDEINSKASDALRDRNIQARNNALQCASIVLVSGFVESNLKANAEAFFIEIGNARTHLRGCALGIRRSSLRGWSEGSFVKSHGG